MCEIPRQLHHPKPLLNNHYYEAVKNQFVINIGRWAAGSGLPAL